MSDNTVKMASVTELSGSACVICESDETGDGNARLSVVTDGRQTLLDASIERKDTKLTKHLLSNPPVVKIHGVCRILYNTGRPCPQLKRKFDSEEEASAECPPKLLRSTTESGFDWKTDCLLCCRPAAVSVKIPKSRLQVRIAETTTKLFQTLTEACEKRNDKWGFEVIGRLQTCGDAVAAEARYHVNCYRTFTGGRPRSNVVQGESQSCSNNSNVSGRRVDADLVAVFDEVCNWLEDYDDDLHTVVELQEQMRQRVSDPETVYSVKHLKRLLEQRYGNALVFASVSGRKDVICFKDMVSRILSDKWYADRQKDAGKESERIIEAAAKLLRASIMEVDYDNETYPLNSVMRDRAIAKQWLPPLLQKFLQRLIKDEIKQIALGHSIVQCCRPRSVISPVLFGIGVSVDLVEGAQWLVKDLSRLGFSLSIDEVTRFKQSVVQSDGNDLPPYGPNVCIQWAADNVDHNVKTLDGTGTFHGMGIISISVGPATDSDEVPVKRLTRVTVGNLVRGRGVQILRYIPPQQPVLSQIVFAPFESLGTLKITTSSELAACLDLVWQTGWFFRDQTKPRPNWGGFMQLVNRGDHPPVAQFRMLPIMDLNPGDRSCILSTLSHVIEQAKKVNVKSPCITFDQPLWLKAVEVTVAQSLEIVVRLGGFHT